MPASWIVWRTRPAWAVRLPSGLLGQQLGEHQQAVERRAQLVRHVGQELRLVPRGQRELLGALLQVRRACSIWKFCISIARFCLASSAAFSSSSALERRSSACWRCSSLERSCSSAVSRWDSASSASVRELAMIVLIVTPMVSTNWSKKARCTSLNGLNEASSITPSTRSSNRIGSTMTLTGRRLAQARADLDVAGGQVVDQDRLVLHGGLADQALAEREADAVDLVLADAVPGHEHQLAARRRAPRRGRTRRTGPRPAA